MSVVKEDLATFFGKMKVVYFNFPSFKRLIAHFKGRIGFYKTEKNPWEVA